MSYNTKNHRQLGGAVDIIGGELRVEPGAKITNNGVQATHIANEVHCAGAAPTAAEYNDLVDKFNALVAATQGVGIVAAS